MAEPHKVKTLWAIVEEEGTGETVAAAVISGLLLPLVASTEGAKSRIIQVADAITKSGGPKLELRRYELAETERTFE